MSILKLFPARVRWCNPDGTLTPEAVRMLEILVERVGGLLGDSGADVFAPGVAAAAPHAPDVMAGASPADAAPVDIVGIASPVGYMAPVDTQPASSGGFLETIFQGGSK